MLAIPERLAERQHRAFTNQLFVSGTFLALQVPLLAYFTHSGSFSFSFVLLMGNMTYRTFQLVKIASWLRSQRDKGDDDNDDGGISSYLYLCLTAFLWPSPEINEFQPAIEIDDRFILYFSYQSGHNPQTNAQGRPSGIPETHSTVPSKVIVCPDKRPDAITNRLDLPSSSDNLIFDKDVGQKVKPQNKEHITVKDFDSNK